MYNFKLQFGMIYILTDKYTNGGTETWMNNLCSLLDSAHIKYVVQREKIEKSDIEENSHVVFNNYNYQVHDIFESDVSKISAYFVIHSDNCPYNSYLVKNIKYINNVIFVSDNIRYKLENKILKLKSTMNFFTLSNFCVGHISKNFNKIMSDSEQKPNLTKKTVFNYIGRISHEKNIPMLLYALSQFDCDKWMLNIYGDTHDKRYYTIIQNVWKSLPESIKNQIIFHGFVSDKTTIYSDCDYVILPSISEGSSYTVIEAFNYNVPVIAIKNVGNNNNKIINGTNGYLVDFNLDFQLDQDSNEIYVNNYHEILKKIGYVEAVLMHDYDGDGIIKLVQNRIIVPPNLYKVQSPKFDSYTQILKESLDYAIKNKLKITLENDNSDNSDNLFFEQLNSVKKIFGFY